MLRFIFAVLFIATFTAAFDDTPFSNFTWKLPGPLSKPCAIPSHSRVHKKWVEGRWYGQEVSYTEDQVKTLRCYHWDSFFDKHGVLHDFFYLEENGQTKVVIAKELPIKGKEWSYTCDSGPAPAYENVYTTILYLDKDVQLRYYVQCLENGEIYRDLEVGYRDVAKINTPKMREKVKRAFGLAKNMEGLLIEEKFGENIAHENCQYQPEMKNPYT